MRLGRIALGLVLVAACKKAPEPRYTPENLVLLTDEQFERLRFRARENQDDFTIEERTAIIQEHARRLHQETERLNRAIAAEMNTADYWKSCIAQLRPGMSRKEVEEIIPWYDTGEGRGEAGTGGGAVLTYTVSPDWSVQIGFLSDQGLAEGTVLLFSNDGKQKFEVPVRRR